MTLSLRLLSALLILLAAAPAALALSDVEADGPITALTATSLTVDGVTFAITDATEIEDADGDATTADALAVGLDVEVEGDYASDGTLEADRIRVDDADADDEVEADGPIEAVDAGSITVAGRTFAITDTTAVTDDDGRPVSADTLAVGMTVEVDGFTAADGTLVASHIEIDDSGDGDGDDDGDDDGEDDDEIEFEGPITAVTDSGIVVGALAVRITDATRIEGDGDPTRDDLRVGVRVEVEGFLDDAGQIVASEIEVDDDGDDGEDDEGDDDEDVEVTGTIDALDGSSLTVAGLTFAITDATAVEGDDDQPLTTADLALGQLVEVHAVYAADGSLVARRIEIEDFDDDEAELTGTIDALEASALVVAGLRFEVTEATVVLDDDRQPITFETLAVGMIVEVRGTVDAAGVRTATRIQIEDRLDDEVELTAALDAVGDGFVVSLGKAFAIADGAVVPAGLAAGDVVEIHAALQVGGDLVATAIEREDRPASFVELRAPVTAVRPDTLVALGVPFAIDAGTALVGRDGAATTLDAIAPGMSVEITATATAAGLVASRVEVRSAASASGVVATGGAGLAVGGIAVTLAPDARVVTPAGVALSASAVASGQTVRAVGTSSPSGLLASRVVVYAAASAVAAEDAPAAATLRVFPNPTAGSATVEIGLATAADVTITVYSTLGREVARLRTTSATAALDTAGLPAGLYLVRVAVDGRPLATTTVTVVR